MERHQAMADAEAAAEWAKAISESNPPATNYERLKLSVEYIVRTTDAATPVVIWVSVPMAMAHWACLSRLMLMDQPGLSDRIHPHFIPALDSQVGNAWIRRAFIEITGHLPAVHNWQRAKDVCAR